jgi:hypothetical protein
LLHIDNFVSDNRNCFVFTFSSLLRARRVFNIVEVGFLLLGHTHEYIHGSYWRLSTQIK